MMRNFLFLLVHFLFVAPLSAQVALEFVYPEVTHGSKMLRLPFAGGINSAQYQTIDLDGDDDLDLVVFDRSSDKINCFENTGTQYDYRPAFEFLFPTDIQHWMVLADFDCDGQKDLFTYTGQGIRVFRNVATGGGPIWELEIEPLKTQGSSSKINLLFNPTDIPSISDIDDDGDLDILVFEFSSSNQIEFHRNHSIENSQICGLDFVRETRAYGDIRDCGCDDFTVDDPCASTGRILHAGGKALLSLDQNADGLMDLVVSQETCENLSYTQNIGTTSQAVFEPFVNDFPLFTSPIGFVNFPAAFYEDVTFDGQKDILVSSNMRANTTQEIDFQTSSFVYQNKGANAFAAPAIFLQNEMIDVGEFAYPSLVDIDGDGSQDLVIGNAGRLINGIYLSTLMTYQRTSAGLVQTTDDLFGLSALGYTYIKPQFVDINSDGKIDLVFSALDDSHAFRLYYVLNTADTGIAVDLNQIQSIPISFTVLDDFHLDDVNGDGFIDCLLGLSSGKLNYYRNDGTHDLPTFVLDTEAFLGLDFNSYKSNLSLSTGDLDGDGRTDLITTDRSGELAFYSDYATGTAVAQQALIRLDVSENLLPSRLGRVTKPAVGELLGRTMVAVGSIQGGIRLLGVQTASAVNELTLKAFPIPTNEDRIVHFQSNLSETRLEIFTLTGKKVAELMLMAYLTSAVHLSHLDDGLYLAKATNGGQSCSVKILVGP
ncbi:T9SS type A sorting domain-containing protein [Reichenbachiella carrageenanivorans]|uniref:T9SS type A sorting domain-containing protein n=1 Tax=Reichenbachiella carrageenanivorans TaxID=2979869 RepID=A0ABY6D2S5_9BACT|nr:T9SS type A sorting domain-containing protein [Reichenbachiella carrageenanivorans]UXX80456.1 T9SS type A sorting domain-containing protein [Reichenbachiella carrageenanivorans]